MKTLFYMSSALWFSILIVATGNAQPTNFYEYVRDYYEIAPSSESEEEDGPNEQMARLVKIWGDRLYPDGYVAKAAQALNDYVEQFNSYEGIPVVEKEWNYLGPDATGTGPIDAKWTGRINRILFDPQYGISNWRVFACTAHGGLWISDDRGFNWQVGNTDTQKPIASAADVAVSFQNSNHVFLATGEPDQSLPCGLNPNTEAINPIYTTGVYRSLDGGLT